jgi:GntR family transcriptional repressor for pyruvate dehydrogenase complex
MVLMTENKSLWHMLELRVGIEGEAAYLAALRREGNHLAKLKAAMAALEEALVIRGVAIQEDYQFHYSVAEATGNPVFLKVMASLADLFLKGFRESTRSLYHEPDRTLANRQEHQRILDAIVEQRADDARTAMVSHLKHVFDRLKQAERLPRKERTDE